MASAIAIPPLATMSLTSIWLESIVYGANIIIFAGCLFVLLTRREVHRLLLLSSTFLFCLSTAHIAISYVQLLRAFTNPVLSAIPHGSDLYFANPSNPLNIAGEEIYIVNVFAQDLLLIWRLYVVWNRNWMIVVVPLIVEIVHIVCAFIAVGLLAKPGSNIFAHSIQAWGLAGWSLDLVVNTTVTLAIAYRLWAAGRRVAAISSRFTYKTTMFTVIESGAIFAAATLIIFALDVSGSAGGQMGINVAVQLATTTPLLIIVRVGLGITHGSNMDSFPGKGLPSGPSFGSSRGIEVNITRSADAKSDYPLHSVPLSQRESPPSLYRPSYGDV